MLDTQSIAWCFYEGCNQCLQELRSGWKMQGTRPRPLKVTVALGLNPLWTFHLEPSLVLLKMKDGSVLLCSQYKLPSFHRQ